MFCMFMQWQNIATIVTRFNSSRLLKHLALRNAEFEEHILPTSTQGTLSIKLGVMRRNYGQDVSMHV